LFSAVPPKFAENFQHNLILRIEKVRPCLHSSSEVGSTYEREMKLAAGHFTLLTPSYMY